MPMIPDDEIERIKREADLAAVVRSRGVELKPSGGDLLGLCPFHADQTPSLHVTPAKRLWRCVSCHATGNVIQFVQRYDGVSFRHAFELLKTGKLSALAAPSPGAPVKKSTVPRLDSPLSADADDQAALRQVLDYYHARLKENPAALAYLAKRGIKSAEALALFKIGFVDRTLGLRLPNNQRKEGATLRARLARLGILREKTGHEHLRGRVVFPVVAESGEIGTVYGRAIDDGGKHDRHLFLPGPQRGVWNPAALRSREIILCEGVIDALTFWCAGFRHVTTSYSAKALPEELLAALLAAKVARVFIAFDRDKAGDDGAAEVAAQLAAHGVGCLRVQFPPGYDANRYAVEVTPPEKSLGVLLRAALPMGERRQAVRAPVLRGVVAATSKTEVSSSPVASAPSSLAAKAASEAASAVPASEVKSPPSEAATSAAALAAREENQPAAVPSASPNPSPVVVAKNDAEEIVLLLGEREWRVRGLAKNAGFESLKVTLRVACGERWHLDNFDLCLARSRENFVTAAAAETLLKPDLLKRDLGHVLRQLEELQEARLKAEAAPKKTESPPMSAAEREAALALLRDPKLLDRILADFAACGVVGEETNKLVGYLATVSRLLDRPLAVIVRATTAAGKSALMDAVLALVPPEQRIKYSALTGQALYYLGGETSLKNKILAIVEEEGAEKASYALKLLQSEGELSIASTGKDPHTGRMVTQEYRVEGPVMIFLTTTAVDLDEELLNRCIVLTVDESREQTAAIHAQQRRAETLHGLREDEARAAVLTLHRAAQRLLRPLKVVNPYGEKLTFLDDRTRTRRDHKKYLTLIRTIALLHQHQRPVQTMTERGQPVEYIEVTLDDIAAANRLAHDVLGRCLDDMPPQTRRLLGLIHEMEKQRAQIDTAATPPRQGDARASRVQGLRPCWRRRDLRAACGWGDTALKVHLARLVDLEYVSAQRDPEHFNGQVYELVFDGDVTAASRPHLSGLLDIEALRRAESTPTAENRSGQNGGWSGVGQPSVGGQSGVGQGGKNDGSPSEESPGAASAPENARPRPGEENAAA